MALRGLPANAPTEPSADPTDALVLESIGKSYDGASIIDGFSLRIETGERVCLMAPTGTGKTTVLNMLLGLTAPDGGAVDAPRPLGIVLQETALAEDLTARQNIILAASPNVSEPEIKAALDELLPTDAAAKKAIELSGGMKRLTELVRALFSPGRAIVLDEPFAGLDTDTHERACAFIRTNLHDRPLIIATHDANDAVLLDATIIRLES